MGYFNRNNNDSRRGGFGSRGGGFGGGRGNFGDRGGRQSFDAVCSNCGRDCTLPFRPNGSKPVLCRDCFASAGGNNERNFSDRPRYENRERLDSNRQTSSSSDLSAINAKLDKILSILGSSETTKSKKAPYISKKDRKEEEPTIDVLSELEL